MHERFEWRIRCYLLRMTIDDKPVKGRGASVQVANRFLQRSYGVVHEEGVDGVEEEGTTATRTIETHSRTIINPVNSADLHFRWTINPYQGCEHGCSYCYARPTHEYWGYSAGLDFERVILVKRNAPELLERELRKPNWKGETISLSGVTDPYQPVERTFQLTRRLMEVALAFKQPLMLITKNALVLRDLDLLAAMAKEDLVQVAISLTTLDEDLRRVLEPRTSTGQKRLEAIEALSAAGVPTMAMLAPIIPALNQHEVPELLKRAALAGAKTAGYTVLRTNGAVKEVFETWLRHHFPDRAEKVLAQTRALHGGSVSDSVPGRRMQGDGPFADSIRRTFKVFLQRYYEGRDMHRLRSDLFHRPPTGQLELLF